MNYHSLLKQTFVLFKTKWFLEVLKGNIYSIASFEIISNLKHIVPEINFIIDVGANSGQFTKVCSKYYPNSPIYSFEPMPDFYNKIKKKFEKSPNIKTCNYALGNEKGFISFNKNEYGHVSSILDIDKNNIHYPNEKLTKIEVEISTLNEFFKTIPIASPSLLKLDVQGYELEVLKGGSEIVKQIDYIIVEANLEKLYDKQPTFTELNEHLNNIGFELNGMLDFNLGKNNKYIEVDLLFKNKNKNG